MARRFYSSTAARTTLAAGVDGSQTTMSVTAVSGWPTSFPYTLVIDQDTVNEELVEVTGRTGTTITVTRGIDGTSGTSHDAGAVVQHGVSARDFDEPNAFINGTGTVTETLLASGAVTEAKLGTGAVTSAKILDGTIVNADINASAAIAQSKIANLTSDLASKLSYATPTNAQTGTTYTFVADDANRLTSASNGSAVTLTIPPQSSVAWADNTILRVVNYGAGDVTIDGGSGVTVTNTATTIGQYEAASAIRTGSDAWTLVPFGGGGASGPTVVEYLVIAGGGGGGGQAGGGGGAGGYRCSVVGENSGGGASADTRLVCDVGTTYTVTVGAGGAAGGNNVNTRGVSGSNSVFSSVTATGGGGGAALSTQAASTGGSGGGGTYNNPTGAAGTSSQGYAGGNGGLNTTGGNLYACGGGGGAGQVGQNGPTTGSVAGGAGGNGVASSITGTSVTRGGGGGGGTESFKTGGAGGTGGGGAGSSGTADGVAGTANTGGGGGGGFQSPNYNGGAGGSGIVIIRYSDSFPAAASTTGSPTVTTSGGYRIYTWTASGSITF